MKIKHTFTLFCVTLTLAFLLVSCADTSGGGGGSNTNGGGDNGSNTNGGGDTTEKQFSNVSAESCGDSTLELNCFISVWNTANSGNGASAGSTIVLPLVNNGEYNFYVDWGDGKEVELITTASAATHTYDTKGEKTIHIAGTIKGWRFYVEHPNFGDAVKLLDVKQWGSLSLGNTAGRQFQGAGNFNPTATDAPDLSETTDLSYAFATASDFNREIGNWDVSKVTQMIGMFFYASAFNQDISAWDVGEVTSMIGMFYEASSFNNKDGEELDWGDKTSNVSDMSSMFYKATSFNQDIGGWDVGEVTNMNKMFNLANKFNNKAAELKWGGKTSKVTDMQEMFSGASDFNQDISAWDVGNVEKNDDFATGSGLALNNIPFKFREIDTISKAICDANPLTNCFISVWNTENSGNGASAGSTIVLPLVNNGEYNFYVDWGDGEDVEKIEAYDAPAVTHTYKDGGEKTIHIAGTIKGWRFYVEHPNFGDAVKLLNVTQWGSLSLGNTDGRQFQNAENFNPTATDAPDLSETTSLVSAFYGASNFNADISDWDVSKVTDMSYMFNFATSFNNNGKPLDWGDKTSNVTDMNNMFNLASAFNQAIGDWKVSEVTIMTRMFNGATEFNQNISGWNVEKVTSSGDFAENSGLELNNIPFKFRGLDTISKAICDANPLTNCFISVWNTANSGGGASDGSTIVLPLVNNGEYNFYVDWGDESEVEYITNYSDATHTYSTEDAEGEKTIHIAGTIKGWRFYSTGTDQGDAAKLLNVTQWGSLSLGNTAGSQFFGAENFNPTATDAPDVSETTNLVAAFYRASNFNADINDWDVSQVTQMKAMFANATSFNNNGVALNWGDKTSKVTDMRFMFSSASAFNQDISGWNVRQVTYMSTMFSDATSFNNGDEKLDWGDKTSKVTDMRFMFNGASAFNQDISGWNVSEVINMTEMFRDAPLFNQNISGWKVEKVMSHDLFATGSGIENKANFLPKFK